MSPKRRPMGALESAVLEQIWSEPDGLTPREVLDRLDEDLAYTTVMTIMNRLWTKGLLDRAKEGRAFRYWPLTSESDLVAAKMSEALSVARDREASLSRFVEVLDPDDGAILRSLLEKGL
ncbi:MAG TPA: BlaI/MecI/CopY family transcriptional regulator [Microthrixaceae bacterium]|nr:BlaI/MecI/CopY family transcriptional regulator [Microthrixaceae bacterium]